MPVMDQMKRYVVMAADETLTAVGVATFTRLYGLRIENNSNAADIFLQMFDAADPSDVTLGTDAPKYSLRIPAGGSAIIDPNRMGPVESFGKGLVFAITAGRTNATAPGADAYAEFTVGQN